MVGNIVILLTLAAFVVAIMGTAMNAPRIIGAAIIILSGAVLLGAAIK